MYVYPCPSACLYQPPPVQTTVTVMTACCPLVTGIQSPQTAVPSHWARGQHLLLFLLSMPPTLTSYPWVILFPKSVCPPPQKDTDKLTLRISALNWCQCCHFIIFQIPFVNKNQAAILLNTLSIKPNLKFLLSSLRTPSYSDPKVSSRKDKNTPFLHCITGNLVSFYMVLLVIFIVFTCNLHSFYIVIFVVFTLYYRYHFLPFSMYGFCRSN